VESPSIFVMIFAFLLVLAPLVVVHELGHYLVGRWFGVKADAFSVGFGKELVGWNDKRGTRWKISAIPLGGYVQFAGDMNAASAPDTGKLADLPADEREHVFHAKPLWQRALIVLAGPLTNLLVAIAIFSAFNLARGKPVSEPVVLGFTEHSDARAAGIRLHDRIVAISGNRVESVADIAQQVAPYPGERVTVAVERDGREMTFPVALTPDVMRDQFGNEGVGADLGIDFVPSVVGAVSKGSVAARAGIEAGDRIVSIDGIEVSRFSELPDLVGARAGRSTTLTVQRKQDRLTFTVVPERVAVKNLDGKTVEVGRLGIAPAFSDWVPVGPVEAVTMAAGQSVDLVKLMVTGIKQIVVGERSVKELGGPIKIAKYSGERLSLGWADFVHFAALISINLAFINLLPIPALDGGHLAFYAAEAVRRKPLGARSQEWAFRTGLAFVLALMVLVTINDLASVLKIGG
jgi:regulator of sigma E protease